MGNFRKVSKKFGNLLNCLAGKNPADRVFLICYGNWIALQLKQNARGAGIYSG
ncbi:hypothetical protein SAMN04488057_106246 [Cyclobacterium lianum]|uniref:Uncharacterized protein n=1 Tax=Cyclobacterium lianum TaxID=388280 RepID=A0A1M7P1B0_9BACT|nr:hypothetical protein SAMN04488057_106246 [Cyclobacterium lianum]